LTSTRWRLAAIQRGFQSSRSTEPNQNFTVLVRNQVRGGEFM
jgi:hypothetical protein